jgi:hypothetical protein
VYPSAALLPLIRRAEEAAAAAEIARIEEAALEVGHKFSSLAEEAAEKTKKLKKLWKKYQVGAHAFNAQCGTCSCACVALCELPTAGSHGG